MKEGISLLKPLRFKTVIYDLDGTLVDSFKDIAAAANKGMIACGREPLSLDEWKDLVGYGMENLFRWALAGGKDAKGRPLGQPPAEEQVLKAVSVAKGHYAEFPVVHSNVYPQVLEVIKEFRNAGIKQAVLTNKPHPIAVSTVRQLELEPLLDGVLGESSQFPPKPHPQMIQSLMAEMNAGKDSTLMVGDAETDAETAHRAGIPACLLTYGSRSRKFLQTLDSDWLIDRFEDLREIIYE